MSEQILNNHNATHKVRATEHIDTTSCEPSTQKMCLSLCKSKGESACVNKTRVREIDAPIPAAFLQQSSGRTERRVQTVPTGGVCSNAWLTTVV